MRAALTERFHAERERFRLVFTCEECVYLDAGSGRCAHGYPNRVHLREAFAPAGASDGMFCKEFEIV